MQAAYAYLQNYVASRRGKVQERVAAAVATHAAEGGTTMHEHPDFLLPFLVQVPPYVNALCCRLIHNSTLAFLMSCTSCQCHPSENAKQQLTDTSHGCITADWHGHRHSSIGIQ